jgi:hypothetical protein
LGVGWQGLGVTIPFTTFQIAMKKKKRKKSWVKGDMKNNPSKYCWCFHCTGTTRKDVLYKKCPVDRVAR